MMKTAMQTVVTVSDDIGDAIGGDNCVGISDAIGGDNGGASVMQSVVSMVMTP
eukprot:m.199697 g.199697  ORF g.199697 m.199697 type:complete len:53 (-) comp32745_c0_seq3:33-191(-)